MAKFLLRTIINWSFVLRHQTFPAWGIYPIEASSAGGSAEVEYPQFTRKFMTTTMVEVLCFPHILDKTFYCEKCQHTWPASVEMRPKTDRLNWPRKEEYGMVKNEKG
jgi:hypothetical protein